MNLWRALHGIFRTDRYDVFVYVTFVHVVEMTIMKIVYMAVMPNRGVSAVWAMAVRVVLMVFLGASCHRQAPSVRECFALKTPGHVK